VDTVKGGVEIQKGSLRATPLWLLAVNVDPCRAPEIVTPLPEKVVQ
jgi:hypothetical protein